MPKRLTQENRIQIQNLIDRKCSIDEICHKVGIHKTTYYRELRKCKGAYSAIEAQKNTYKGFHPIDYDIIGKTFGLLVVKEFVKKVGRRTWWKCQCTCGNFCIIKRKILVEYCSQKRSLSCGCEPKQWGGNNCLPLPYEELCYRKYLDLMKFKRINGDCWEWTGYLGRGVTPRTSFRNVAMSVRKCMYMITRLIENLSEIVYTTCGNLLCFNPDHLTLQIPKVRAIKFKKKFPKSTS